MQTESPAVSDRTAPKLRRELNIWEAIGVSIALMAPSMAININPQGTAGLVGRAVPLAFVVATVGVLLIAYTFVRLTQRFHHSGSVYGFVGVTLGPRAGAFSGWVLAGTYLFYAVVTAVASGRFIADLVRSSGAWADAPDWLGFVFATIALGLVTFLATRPARGGTRILLVVEATTIALIVVVAIVILGRLLSHTAPDGQTFTLDVFTLPAGSDSSSVFLGVVFAFLSFAGFEAAATLGEEAKNPRRDIPRAILGTAIFGGVFFTVITAIEVMGFGTSAKQITAFANSGSLVGDLAGTYLSPVIGTVITLGATVSGIACCLACVVASSRLVFALSRDGLGPAPLGVVSAKHNVPARAAGAVSAGVLIAILVAWFVVRGTTLDLFLASATAGTLILLVVYGLATIGAIRLLFFSGTRQVAIWEVVIPVLALVVVGYTLFRNVIPLPEGSAWWGPGLSIAWLVITLVYVAVAGKAATRAGRLLAESEGLRVEA